MGHADCRSIVTVAMVQGNNCHGVGHGLMPQSCCLMAVTKPWHIKQPKCGSWCLSALPNEYFFLYLLWVGPGWGCTSPALRRPNTICLRRSCRPSSECNLVQLVNEMPRRCRQEHRGLNGSMHRGCELRQKKSTSIRRLRKSFQISIRRIHVDHQNQAV